jgi:HK97 gp10 family phage protein
MARVVVVSNRFEELAVKLRSEAEHLVADVANKIEAEMKAGTSARIGATVRSKVSNGGLTATVTAGDRDRALHAGFEEYGTVDNPGRPFATPAAENNRHRFNKAAQSLLDRGL